MVHPYRQEWAAEGEALAHSLLVATSQVLAVEHIGSTAVPGLAAKDCLDMMLVVQDLDTAGVESELERIGYRRRAEPWNNVEPAAGKNWPKMTFAPPVGGRAQNIHVRTADSATARVALLFRDHLREHPQRTAWWAALKVQVARVTDDLDGYGQIKHPAWCLLMDLAEMWAEDTGWRPPRYTR